MVRIACIRARRLVTSKLFSALGLILPSACIFLGGRVFLWNVPTVTNWDAWTPDHFKVFEVVTPRPGSFFLHGTPDASKLRHISRNSHSGDWRESHNPSPKSKAIFFEHRNST